MWGRFAAGSQKQHNCQRYPSYYNLIHIKASVPPSTYGAPGSYCNMERIKTFRQGEV
jgi:hypothetical protein